MVLVLLYPNWESLHSSLCCCSLCFSRQGSPTTTTISSSSFSRSPIITISSSPLSLSPTPPPPPPSPLIFLSQDLKLSPLFEIHLVTCSFGVVADFGEVGWWCDNGGGQGARVSSGREEIGVVGEKSGLKREMVWGWIF